MRGRKRVCLLHILWAFGLLAIQVGSVERRDLDSTIHIIFEEDEHNGTKNTNSSIYEDPLGIFAQIPTDPPTFIASIEESTVQPNTTETRASTTDSILTEDAFTSWSPILATLALVCFQATVCLIIFESARRSPSLEEVFDKRRRQHPKRTPPPLMKRGCFEWCTFQLANDDYTQQAQAEWNRLQAQRATHCINVRMDGPMDETMLQAERETYEKFSPMAFNDDVGANADVDEEQPSESGEEEEYFCDKDFDLGKNRVVIQNTGKLVSKPRLEVEQDGDGRTELADGVSTAGGGGTSSKTNIAELISDEGSVTGSEGGISTPKKVNIASKDWADWTDKHHGIDDDEKTTKASGNSVTTYSQKTGSGGDSCPKDDSLETINEDRPASVPTPIPDRSPMQRSKTVGDKPIIRQSERAASWHGNENSLQHDPVPLTVGGQEDHNASSPNTIKTLRHRFSSTFKPQKRASSIKTVTSRSTDITFGTPEFRNRAKEAWQHDIENEWLGNWDAQAVATLSGFVRSRVLQIQQRDEEHKKVRASYIKDKIVRRKLTPEQEKLLHCVGLDAFVTLRFCRFGFDVAFWPFALSLLTIIPVYISGKEEDISPHSFFAATVLALDDDSPRHWVVVLFAFCQFCYILRRIWIEWEIFLPLRYDFLENGDCTEEGKYQDQYRKTCVIEYLPEYLNHDKDLEAFVESIFPGKIRRAEVLLNNEYLRELIKERMDHIIAYEDIYAQMVHDRAQYIRAKHRLERYGEITGCCKKAVTFIPEPKPRKIIVRRLVEINVENAFMNLKTQTAVDARTHMALPYHAMRIQDLNKKVEEEYIRLAMAKESETLSAVKRNRINRVGQYLLKNETSRGVRSTTAFVEFKTLVAKQQAIQCNLTGLNRYLRVRPCPGIREVIWSNMHVPQVAIETRKFWVNIVLAAGLILWSYIVSAIRAATISEWFAISNELLAAFFEDYVPALVVEFLVRGIPFGIKALCSWVRLKSHSDIEYFTVRWYFGYRFVTFIFVIIGGTLIDSGEDIIEDPLGYFKVLSDNAVENSQFFCTYVLAAGASQLFFRLSQVHNVALFWAIKKTTLVESKSQRQLDKIQSDVKTFHLEEFIPLFLFIFMIGALYGALAPLSCFFVAAFFLIAERVFRFMAVFVYGSLYEAGGKIMYTLNAVLFATLYLVIIIICSYLGSHGSTAMAGVFFLQIFIVAGVNHEINRRFVRTSKTLSLTKAQSSDERKDGLSQLERKQRNFLEAKEELQKFGQSTISEDSFSSSEEEKAIRRMQKRYEDVSGSSTEGAVSEVTQSQFSSSRSSTDFFVYRQPSLNRSTWEVAPRPYRCTSQCYGDITERVAESWH